MAEIDWSAIRAAYIAGGESISDLAERFCVSRSTLGRKCKSEKWVELRRRAEDETIMAQMQEAVSQRSEAGERAVDVATYILDLIIESLIAEKVGNGSISLVSIDRAMKAVQTYCDIMGIKRGLAADEVRARIKSLQRSDENKNEAIVVHIDGIEDLAE